MKKAVVCGAGGFIGSHLVNRLKSDGWWVRGVDLKFPEFADTSADDFIQGDLRDLDVCNRLFDQWLDEATNWLQIRAELVLFLLGDNDAEIMHNSASINLNVLETLQKTKHKENFFTALLPACTRNIIN